MQHLRTKHWFPILAYFVISFVLHLVWENVQAPLYDCYMSFWQCFWVCLRATVTGDMLFMLTIFVALAAAHRNWFWLSDARTYRHTATWVLPLIIGVLLAVSFELWAVYVVHRFGYNPAMPLIPIVQVGLTPVLQMIVVPWLTLWLTYKVLLRK